MAAFSRRYLVEDIASAASVDLLALLWVKTLIRSFRIRRWRCFWGAVFPHGGIIFLSSGWMQDQRTDSLVERCGISLIDGGGSRRHGAVVTLRPMRGDGLAQEGDAVWRRGGVDGS